MKRIFTILILTIVFSAFCFPAFATDASLAFDFILTADGKSEKTAETDDIITVSFTLERTDSDASYTMYAMQNEISYDSSFFELVAGSVMTAGGIETTDIALRDGYRALYMNFLSKDEGAEWNASTLVGSFQLKVIGTSGSSVIENRNCIVSTPDGTDGYASTARNMTVTVSNDCTVHFETNGGTSIEDLTVAAGSRISKPEDPEKEGYILEGWYSDYDCTKPWDFGSDTVSGNMTLYAKWVAESGILPKTGDDTMIRGLLILVAVILALVLFLMAKRKRTQAQ